MERERERERERGERESCFVKVEDESLHTYIYMCEMQVNKRICILHILVYDLFLLFYLCKLLD